MKTEKTQKFCHFEKIHHFANICPKDTLSRCLSSLITPAKQEPLHFTTIIGDQIQQ